VKVWDWPELIQHLEDPHGMLSTGDPAQDVTAHEQDHERLDYPHTHGNEAHKRIWYGCDVRLEEVPDATTQ
jgi:hypothetical protein